MVGDGRNVTNSFIATTKFCFIVLQRECGFGLSPSFLWSKWIIETFCFGKEGKEAVMQRKTSHNSVVINLQVLQKRYKGFHLKIYIVSNQISDQR